jgi:hypothetical protein
MTHACGYSFLSSFFIPFSSPRIASVCWNTSPHSTSSSLLPSLPLSSLLGVFFFSPSIICVCFIGWPSVMMDLSF